MEIRKKKFLQILTVFILAVSFIAWPVRVYAAEGTASTKYVIYPVAAEMIEWNPAWEYADYSVIHTGSARLYRTGSPARKNITVSVNAGHGTKGGANERTLCHPDGSPKVTGGSTAAGNTTATAVAGGMTFKNGVNEPSATLFLALMVRNILLNNGYDVLMIRESDDVQLDNIARTVMANNNADCHIALHFDSTDTDKGLFYCAVPKDRTYRAMEPVKSHYKEHTALGDALVYGAKQNGQKIYNGKVEIDLTQTSFSTIPSVDLEVGDAASDISAEAMALIARGVVKGVNNYYGKSN